MIDFDLMRVFVARDYYDEYVEIFTLKDVRYFAKEKYCFSRISCYFEAEDNFNEEY